MTVMVDPPADARFTIVGALIGLFGILLPISFSLMAGFLIKANWDGICLNLATGKMSFPGGGISANEFTDYFDPKFLLQAFRRSEVDINQISQIGSQDITRKSIDSKGNVSYSSSYVLRFNGTFGAASVTFADSGKRDQIYNLIRQVNRMGTPVFEA